MPCPARKQLCSISVDEKPMKYDPAVHHRQSIRLKGHDYSEPGYYFVNICAKKKLCLFGEVQDAKVRLSPVGTIVEEEWKKIPSHYLNVEIDAFVAMPNHLHGIIQILDPKQDGASPIPTKNVFGRDRACPVPAENIPRNCSSLFSIVGSYKSGVTKRVHEAGHFVGRTTWQSRFYDHIIRDDVAFYFVRQYIELNPLTWEYSRWNPHGKKISFELFERILKDKFEIDGHAAAIILGSEKMSDLNLE